MVRCTNEDIKCLVLMDVYNYTHEAVEELIKTAQSLNVETNLEFPSEKPNFVFGLGRKNSHNTNYEEKSTICIGSIPLAEDNSHKDLIMSLLQKYYDIGTLDNNNLVKVKEKYTPDADILVEIPFIITLKGGLRYNGGGGVYARAVHKLERNWSYKNIMGNSKVFSNSSLFFFKEKMNMNIANLQENNSPIMLIKDEKGVYKGYDKLFVSSTRQLDFIEFGITNTENENSIDMYATTIFPETDAYQIDTTGYQRKIRFTSSIKADIRIPNGKLRSFRLNQVKVRDHKIKDSDKISDIIDSYYRTIYTDRIEKSDNDRFWKIYNSIPRILKEHVKFLNNFYIKDMKNFKNKINENANIHGYRSEEELGLPDVEEENIPEMPNVKPISTDRYEDTFDNLETPQEETPQEEPFKEETPQEETPQEETPQEETPQEETKEETKPKKRTRKSASKTKTSKTKEV